MREKLITVLKHLSQHCPVQQISAEQLAVAAHVSVEVVLQTLGSAENYPALIATAKP